MAMIEVDFEVLKAITARRESEAMTPNDVLRRMLGLDPVEPARKGWSYKGVLFPNGTEFKASHKGKLYLAKVSGGKLMFGGKPMNSPSEAAMAITKTPANGWTFWTCKLPDQARWRKLNSLREREAE